MRPEQAERWLSQARFHNFLNATEDDHDLAVALYLWNAEVSTAFLGTLHHLEVLLRNAIDRRFPPSDRNRQVSICGAEVWLTDPGVLEDQGREKVNEAIGRLINEGRRSTRARLVASLTLGFWSTLFSGRYEDLWRSTLVGAFPNGNGKRSQIRKTLTRIQQLRNQAAHHEAIFGRNLDKDYRLMLDLAGFIDTEARDYIDAQSRTNEVLARRPR